MLEKAEETFDAMAWVRAIIYQGVLRDAESRMYGSPDFWFAATYGKWHYVVVDTKFVTIHLNASGSDVGNGGSLPAYKAQMYIYNRALRRLQGYLPKRSFLLGRGWERHQRIQGKRTRFRSDDAFDALIAVSQDGAMANKTPIVEAVEEAVDWIRRMRGEGAAWELLPRPSVPELYPNMSNANTDEMMRGVDAERDIGDGDGDKEQ